MLWYHWTALFVAFLSFALWLLIKFGVDVSDLFLLPLLLLDL